MHVLMVAILSLFSASISWLNEKAASRASRASSKVKEAMKSFKKHTVPEKYSLSPKDKETLNIVLRIGEHCTL